MKDEDKRMKVRDLLLSHVTRILAKWRFGVPRRFRGQSAPFGR